MIFALAGNQNCGKTTLFNALTGSNQHVGNFPGVTVDQKMGDIRGEKNCSVVDLPGIYSLRPYTQEEIVTRDFILNQKPDGIINIVDATNIERNLYLTLQLLELRVPMVLALNMMDEVRANGGSIDVQKMSAALGIPVVPISAAKGEGVSELITQALTVARGKILPKVTDFCTDDSAVHRCLHAVIHLISDHAERLGVPTRFCAAKLIEGGDTLEKDLRLDENEKELLTESLRRQIEELERAELKAGEEAELTARSDLLRNFEKLSEAVDQAYDLLAGRDDSASALAGEALSEVERAANYASELVSLPEAVKSAVFTLQDAAETLRDFRDGLDFSDEEFDRIETRLSLLRRLERKYNTDEAGLIDTLEAARTRLDQIEYAGDRLQKLESLIQKQAEQTRAEAAKLTQARQTAAAALEQQVERELRELSMPSARFRVEITPLGGDPGFQAVGADNVRFLISANTGEALGRISKIASGGELSRIMLALKNVFAERDDVPSMVFDEVDAGVGGLTLNKLAEKLNALAEQRQMLLITHWPQLAARARKHFQISKVVREDATFTLCSPLDGPARHEELARMAGGGPQGEALARSLEA